jgi:shikimate dehydrogenase
VQLSPRAAAVLGTPIAHSLSPVLHRAAYAELGLDWTYTAIECEEAGLPALLERADIAGYSCTMPLKRAALRLAATRSARAEAIGAANTLLRRPGGWRAENTDWIGIRDALAATAVPAGGEVTVLGAGGTAQAALAAVSGTGPVTVLVRDPARTGPLRAAAERLRVEVRVGLLAGPIPGDLIISTLPAGAADALEADWAPGRALLDVIYSDWPTALAGRAAAAGAQVVSGGTMLLYQAARQVELMTGRAAPVPAMRAAMLAAAPRSGV